MKNIKLIEVASEIGAGTRGASLGIEAIKIAALDFMSSFFIHFPSEKISSDNRILYEPIDSPYAKRIKGVTTMYEKVSKAVTETIKSHFFPVVISGDHSNAGATITGIKMAKPKSKLGVIWIDAHADLHTPYTTPSGNMHGMPLAIAINEDNEECAVHDVEEETKKQWNHLKNMGKIMPKVLPEDVVFISLRDYEKEEKHLIEKYDMKVITTNEVRRKGPENIVRSVIRYLSDCTDLQGPLERDTRRPDASGPRSLGQRQGASRRDRRPDTDLVERRHRVGSRSLAFPALAARELRLERARREGYRDRDRRHSPPHARLQLRPPRRLPHRARGRLPSRSRSGRRPARTGDRQRRLLLAGRPVLPAPRYIGVPTATPRDARSDETAVEPAGGQDAAAAASRTRRRRVGRRVVGDRRPCRAETLRAARAPGTGRLSPRRLAGAPAEERDGCGQRPGGSRRWCSGAGRRPAQLSPGRDRHRCVRKARRGCDRRHATTDRDFWTFSLPSNAGGHYTSSSLPPTSKEAIPWS